VRPASRSGRRRRSAGGSDDQGAQEIERTRGREIKKRGKREQGTGGTKGDVAAGVSPAEGRGGTADVVWHR